jgi:hypothetical protein
MMPHDSEKQLHLLEQAAEETDPIKNASDELWT